MPLQLPQLEIKPITHGLGQIRHVVRGPQQVNIEETRDVKVSARLTEQQLQLSNGETIILTQHAKLARPEGVDGVLRDVGGSYRWLSHRLVEDFLAGVEERGWKATAAEIGGSWRDGFVFKAENETRGQNGLRPPQVGALHAIGSHWSLSHKVATIVMPTGTGKTETMLAALAAFVEGPMLVVVPGDLLRTQTAVKFVTFGLLRKLGVLREDLPNPIVGIVNKRPKTEDDLDIFETCNVVIATMSVLTGGAIEALAPRIAERVSSLVIDEAHHAPASSWASFRGAFESRRVLQFTATPLRRDKRLVEGSVIYNYPLRTAQKDGYFKLISFEAIYALDQSTSDEQIAKAAIAKLRADQAAGFNHLVMARCENIERAEKVIEIYQRLGAEFNPVLVHSEVANARANVAALRAGDHRVAVCVNMLGEGFDLPELKIAAVHDMHGSLAILLQFTGRFTRTGAAHIGDATVIANIAEPKVSGALEQLYSEDADWNELLSEMSSAAAKEHADLVAFLADSKRLDEEDDDEISISHQLLRPTLSTLVYEAPEFNPKGFHAGLSDDLRVQRVWLNEESNTLYFVTRSEARLKWTRSQEIRDRIWALFILHYDEERNLLFLSSTDHSSLFEKLATAVGATKLVSGDVVFRILGGINRLIFQNMGMKKYGRRNLSFASYTGADVSVALGLTERSGSVKNNVSGTGWEGGERVAVGCSLKGRVWSRDQDSIPAFVRWCDTVGRKLQDDTIDTKDIIANVLIPEEVTALPEGSILGIEWPVEILGQSEERITLTTQGGDGKPLFLFELRYESANHAANQIAFSVRDEDANPTGTFILTIGGERGFDVRQEAGDLIEIKAGARTMPLESYLSDYPPLIRFVDLSELDGNLLIRPQNPEELVISPDRFEAWDWEGVDIRVESIWKDGVRRPRSIQEKVASHYIDAGFDIVFDDDAPGEAADLVCLKEEADYIRLVLVHCKFSGGDDPGERVKDVVEVSSQAIRSAKWKWKFRDLCKHVLGRETRLTNAARPTRFLAGTAPKVNEIAKASRFKEVRPEILIAQPGISEGGLTPGQSVVLASAAAYLKQTIAVDLDIICS